MKRFVTVLAVMVLIPYVTTLAWTGRLGEGDITGLPDDGDFGFGTASGTDGTRTVVVERNGRETAVPAEAFLVSVLAAQIPADFGPETLKAQAVLARTYIYREMDGTDSIPEEALDMDALSQTQMEKLWGSGEFAENYGKLKSAVSETEGMYLACEGVPIEPFFCRAAAGSTRGGDETRPYLRQAESPGDLKADGFLSLAVFTPQSLADRINGIAGAVPVAASDLPEKIQIVERDGAGYAERVQIGEKTYTGDEVRYALGLSSSCFSFEEFEGKIRVTCKGIGHGYGFSQAGAREYEKEGHDYVWLLNHYFQNVEILNDGN